MSQDPESQLDLLTGMRREVILLHSCRLYYHYLPPQGNSFQFMKLVLSKNPLSKK